MDSAELQSRLDDIADCGLKHHGFVAYNRDYELLVRSSPHAAEGSPMVRYLFRHCVLAQCRTMLAPGHWRASLDERLTESEFPDGVGGFFWGVGFQHLYPGGTVVAESQQARNWSKAVGIDFHEVRIETDTHELTLVFSDLRVTPLPG